MPHLKTWPGGGINTSPTSFSIPDSGDLNWANLTAFLDALGDSAQATTFQKYAVRKALTTPVTVSASTDCVVVTQLTSPGAVAVNLPAGANKQVYFIADGTGDASTNNITINPNGADTIAGSASLVLNINRESVMLCYNSSDTDWKIVALNAAGFTNPMTTRGDMIYRNTLNVTARFPVGAVNTVLKSDGTDPAYAQIVDAYISASAAITGSKIVSASNSVAGVVDIASQTFAGAKTFNALTTIGPSAGTTVHVLNGAFQNNTSSPYAAQLGKPSSIDAGTTLPDGTAVTFNGAGTKLFSVYDNSTGNAGMFWCGVNGTTITTIATDGGTWFTTDSGVGYRVYKSSSSTSVNIRNSTGGAKIIAVTFHGSTLIP